jgi:hypothetical protein
MSPNRLPNRLGTNESFLIDKPSGQGGAESCTSPTPRQRSSMTAIASRVSMSKRSAYGQGVVAEH